MVKFLENKQMLHIITEVIVITGLAFYFNNKNKKLASHIEDLSQRIEDLEENFQKQDTLIKTLLDRIKKQEIALKQTQKLITNVPKSNTVRNSTEKSTAAIPPTSPPIVTPRMIFKSNAMPIGPSIEYVVNPAVKFNSKSRIEEVKEDTSEEALDQQLSSELADLEDTLENDVSLSIKVEDDEVVDEVVENVEIDEDVEDTEVFDEEKSFLDLKKKN
jgi:hypothetical protein